MRENCTYGSMRGRAFPTGRPALLYTLFVPRNHLKLAAFCSDPLFPFDSPPARGISHRLGAPPRCGKAASALQQVTKSGYKLT